MGKRKDIVTGTRVVSKDGKHGQVVGMKFHAKTFRATKYQVKWDEGLTTWVRSSEVSRG
jgi:hypothetical protein